jgi:hypothetical protein
MKRIALPGTIVPYLHADAAGDSWQIGLQRGSVRALEVGSFGSGSVSPSPEGTTPNTYRLIAFGTDGSPVVEHMFCVANLSRDHTADGAYIPGIDDAVMVDVVPHTRRCGAVALCWLRTVTLTLLENAEKKRRGKTRRYMPEQRSYYAAHPRKVISLMRAG